MCLLTTSNPAVKLAIFFFLTQFGVVTFTQNTIEACLLCSIYHFLLLYYHTGIPHVTSLTFNGQSNTLTCTSTGGPATNVTWRRDGVVITLNTTHQQAQRVDPAMGTYQTLLTIDPSVGHSDIVGTYNCTVENVRGEASTTRKVTGES